jgi:hypothetical protein
LSPAGHRLRQNTITNCQQQRPRRGSTDLNDGKAARRRYLRPSNATTKTSGGRSTRSSFSPLASAGMIDVSFMMIMTLFSDFTTRQYHNRYTISICWW